MSLPSLVETYGLDHIFLFIRISRYDIIFRYSSFLLANTLKVYYKIMDSWACDQGVDLGIKMSRV